MSLKEWMIEAREISENGKSLMQLSLETYLTEKLGFQLLETKLINKGYEDEFQFVVTKGTNQYVFVNEYYEAKEFAPHQQMLTLKQISGKEGVLTTEHTIWLTNDNGKDKFLFSPLSELMNGTQNDQELRFVVDYLKNAFCEVEGFHYEEKEQNDLRSFVISLNRDITIQKGFSNTVQCDFHKAKFFANQIVFKERDESELIAELDQFIEFVQAYLDETIALDHHNLSSLYDDLNEFNLYPQVNTSTLLSSKKLDKFLLFQPLVIEGDDMFSYHQIQVKIHYLNDKKSFLLETNYLFRTFETECTSVNDVKREVAELVHLIQTTK